MPHYFDSLPSETHFDGIIAAVRDIIGVLHGTEKMTYVAISNMARRALSRTLSPTAIKVFLSSKSARFHKDTPTLSILYDLIRTDYQSFPDAARARTVFHWNTLVPRKINDIDDDAFQNETEKSLSYLLKTWLDVDDRDLHRLSDKLFGEYVGDYVMLRKSVHSPVPIHENAHGHVDNSVTQDSNQHIVKSLLKITHRDGIDKGFLKIRHYHHDRQGILRVSSGFFFPLSTNIYSIMKIEDGEGLELLALRNPIQKQFEKMMGFLISMNMDRNILSGRIFIERDSELWQDIPPRFKVSEINDKPQMRKILNNLRLLEEGPALILPDIQINDT
jgi:hypothetical protein